MRFNEGFLVSLGERQEECSQKASGSKAKVIRAKDALSVCNPNLPPHIAVQPQETKSGSSPSPNQGSFIKIMLKTLHEE